LPEVQSFTNNVRSIVALAPDGSSMVYIANNQIHRRPMDALESTPIRGTAGNPSTPFFSPDGQSLAYWDAGEAQLERIPLSAVRDGRRARNARCIPPPDQRDRQLVRGASASATLRDRTQLGIQDLEC
jgi:hypothetical protein